MFEFHSNKDRYFGMQEWVTAHYVIPFLRDTIELSKPRRILEIGCAEAGVLAAFLADGHEVVGIELSESRAEKARTYLKDAIVANKAQIITKDIFDVDTAVDKEMLFDVVILKDVIEHIHDQGRFIAELRKFLKPGGVVFFAYPPWWMPFGGHQQLCRSKFLSKLPWFHLLPLGLYRSILKQFGESKVTIEALEEIKETGINIERTHKLLATHKFTTIKEQVWLTNPIYSKKFGFKPFKQWINIPYIRNIISTCHYIAFKAV